ncbi:hypothetical protein C8J30_101121 [Rhodobacter viridis]|uniref:Uncharacterized protein n=1 Tax=Rhodobacter viridis TaxID=1054202 RepID=A0A318U2P8_9RHOB|nr:hypothetical protein [Rhodobacter viridis]PYF12740.1 hypothetical protein C8J30_101121 [Rhodobacter viridis]
MATADDAFARKIAADVVDIELSNLLAPDTPWRLEGGVAILPAPEDKVGLATQIFSDRITLGEGAPTIAATTTVIAGVDQMVVLGVLAADPVTDLSRARFLHADCVVETIKVALRRQPAFATQ